MVTSDRITHWLDLVGFPENRTAVVDAAIKELKKLAANANAAEKEEIAATIEAIKKGWPFNQ